MSKRLFVVALVFIVTILGCSLPGGDTPQTESAPTAAPTPTRDYTLELPFEGIWTSEDGTVLILTADRFYLKFLQGQENEVVTENLAKILDYDLEAGHLHIYMDAVLLNTRPGGFDYPQRYLMYQIDGDRIRIMFTNEAYTDEYDVYELTRY
jgi:hypothetical protein